MKRSKIDSVIDEAHAAFSRHGLRLPPFARWSPGEWRARGDDTLAMRHSFLGWNVVEFIEDGFDRSGIAVFTTRMGDHRALPTGRGRLYGEKAILVAAGQRVPYHYHVVKTEDFINRGGGALAIDLVRVDTDGRPVGGEITLDCDGIAVVLPSRATVRLQPGEGITLDPYVAHAFRAEGEAVVCAEISLANDDATDNHFLEPLPPHEPIEEDVPARHVVVADYPALSTRVP